MRIKDLDELKKLLEDSKAYRRSLYQDSDWDKFEDYWFAKYDDIIEPDESGELTELPVPILVSNAQHQMASVLGGDFRITFTARHPDKVPAARILTVKINHLARKVGLFEEIRDAYQDAMTVGTGFLLDGFGSQFGIHPDTPLQGFDPSGRDKDKKRIEYHDSIFENEPFSLRVHPADIYVPPNTVRLAGAKGAFHRYIRHIDEVRADVKLIEKHRNEEKGVQPNSQSKDRSGKYETNQEMVICYDYFNLKSNHCTTFTDDYRFALQDEVDERLIRLDRLPLHAIQFNKNSRHFWATSDFDFTEPLAQEANDIRTMQKQLRRQQIVKAFYDLNMLENAEGKDPDKIVREMVDNKLLTLIGINPGTKAVKDFLAQISPTGQYDMIPQFNLATQNIEEFGVPGGLGSNQRGVMSSGRHTKYEAAITEAHSDRSLYPRRRVVRDVVIDIVTNWCKMIYDFQIEPEICQTYDAAGNPVTVEYRGADLEGDYLIEITLESMRAKSQDERIAEANMILKQSMLFVQMGICNPQALYRQYLSRLSTDWDIETLVMGPGEQAGPPMPFGQYQNRFRRQVPQNRNAIGAFMANQNLLAPGPGPGRRPTIPFPRTAAGR